MGVLLESLSEALYLIVSLNPYVVSITKVQLLVTGAATVLSAITAIPLAVVIALREFRGKKLLISAINTFMGVPPVVVGLFLFILLSSAGPLGFLDLLFTPTAMIIAQYILATPIILSVSISALASVERKVGETALTLGATSIQKTIVVLKEAKAGVITAILTGFSRVIGEVGAILIVGGNIALTGGVSYTRTLTTAITLETAMGRFSTAIALGIILLIIAFITSVALNILRERLR